MPSKIEWTDETWNPVTGCTKVSAGCANCYAERMARRLAGRYGYPEAPYHFEVTLHERRLERPWGWQKPRMVFVCSMGDLFHDDVPADYISMVLSIMKRARRHTFQVLTKRPERMRELTNWLTDREGWPSNVWLGVTVENQDTIWRIDELMQISAAVRFVSFEPLLDDVAAGLEQSDLSERIDWAIVGGESGSGARPMHPDWARALREWALCWGIPFFFKQWGAWAPWIESSFVGSVTGESITQNGEIGDFGNGVSGIGMSRVGKKAAGRLLDGHKWNEMPCQSSVS